MSYFLRESFLILPFLVGDIKFNRGGRVCRSVYVVVLFSYVVHIRTRWAAETFDAIVKTNTYFFLVVVGDFDKGAMRMFVYWFLDRYSEGTLRGITI